MAIQTAPRRIVGLNEAPTVEVPPVFTDPLERLPTVANLGTGVPTVPVAAPSASPSVADPSRVPAGMPLAPGDETGDADLDRFFAALRQVVHDARERLPARVRPARCRPTRSLDVPGSRRRSRTTSAPT